MKKNPDPSPEWETLKHRNWRDVLKALLRTSAPNNPTPATDDPRPAEEPDASLTPKDRD